MANSATPAAMAAARAAAEGLRPVVCYHHPCADGVYAALAAAAHFARAGRGGPPPRFVPLSVFTAPSIPAMGLGGDEAVYMLDYTGPRGFARELAARCARVIVLDHHKTAADDLGIAAPPQHPPPDGGAPPPAAAAPPLPPNVHALLDMGRSGAALALDYFGRDGLPDGVLRAFGYVQDADLWTWALPGSREFHAGLSALKLEYSATSNPAIFDQLMAIDVDAVVQRGAVVLEQQARQIAAAVDAAAALRLGGALGASRAWGQGLGGRVSGELVGWRSALGNALAERARQMGLEPVGVIAYTEEGMAPGRLKVSLRSVGGWDTTLVTEALGGGGHSAASACVIDEDDFEEWKQG
ncbi:MAG: hypothetical protein J3K34DRAFT_523545 [Monoraphidium minutum]|nr:MAG: hypothetical protein J3K34DRAFT_523545 [Monoraphidium minutum]